jgi:hypothetical protein
VKQTRVVENPREFAGYTHGYNHALFAQRVHDVLSLVTFLRNTKVGSHPSPKASVLAGFGQAGPIALAARALAGNAVDRAAVDTGMASASAKSSTTATRCSCPAARNTSTWKGLRS